MKALSRNLASSSVIIRLLRVADRVLCLVDRSKLPPPTDASGIYGLAWRLQYRSGRLEAETKRFFTHVLGPGDIALDIGAHAGYFTRQFSNLVGKSGKVFAYEPHPTNFECLERNVRNLATQNVVIKNMAISDSPGIASLYLNSGHSNHSLCSNVVGSAEPMLSVKTSTLDKEREENGIESIKAIKIDVEGLELAVLGGMQETISERRVSFVVLECNPRAIESTGMSVEEWLDVVNSSGAVVSAIEDDGTLRELGAGWIPLSTQNIVLAFN